MHRICRVDMIHPGHLLALTVSLTAHLCLSVLFGVDGALIRRMEPSVAQPMRTLNVNMVREEQVAKTSAIKFDGVTERKEAGTKTREEMPASETRGAARVSAVPETDAPVFTITTPPESYYFPVNQLTEKPRVLLDAASSLHLALKNGSPQLAVLRLLINERGDIDEVVIGDSLLPGPAQRLVIEAFTKTKFEPGKIDAMPVKSQFRIEVMLESMTP